MRSILYAVGFLAVQPVLGRTDLQGCTSSEVVTNGGASYIFYVPDTGEICSFLDCGGGRAPPKSTVPGCPLYSGTATVTPSFLPGFKGGSSSSLLPTSTTVSPHGSTSSPSVSITGTPKPTGTGTSNPPSGLLTAPGSNTGAPSGGANSAGTSTSTSTSTSTAGAALVSAGAVELMGVVGGLLAGYAAL